MTQQPTIRDLIAYLSQFNPSAKVLLVEDAVDDISDGEDFVNLENFYEQWFESKAESQPITQ